MQLTARKILVELVCVLFAFSAIVEAASKADFYVAVNGNDTWNGQLAVPNAAGTDGPLATLRGARNVIRQMKISSNLDKPLTVLLRGGTYRMLEPVEFLPIDSGSKDAPITYAAYPGEKPVISGGIPITGWQKGKDGRWTAYVPLAKGGKWRFRQMWVNGERCIPARTPNYGKAFWDAGALKPKGDERYNPFFNYSHIKYKKEDSEIWDKLSESKDKGIFVMFHSFSSSFHNINSIDKERRAAFSLNPCRKKRHGDRHYYVAFNRESLDAPGEWYLDTEQGVVSYYPRKCEDMSKANVIAPFGRNLLRLKGDATSGKWVEYLRFEGLTFNYTDWVMHDTAMMDGVAGMPDELRKGNWARGTKYRFKKPSEAKGYGKWITPGQGESGIDHAVDPSKGDFLPTAVVHLTSAQHCEFTACEIAHTGNWALRFGDGSKHNKAEQCHLYDLGAGGVMMGETYLSEHKPQQAEKNVVHNCFIHHGSRVFSYAVGIGIGNSSYNTVSHNEISDFYWSGISMGWTWFYLPSRSHHNLLEYNHIHHLAWDVHKDLGGIYTNGISPGTVIRNNKIHHINSIIRRGRGIYLDQASTEILVENNLVYLVNDGAFHLNWGKNNMVRNNIFAYADEHGVVDGGEGYTLEGNIVCSRRGVAAKRRGAAVSNRNLYWDKDNPEKLRKWLEKKQSENKEKGSIVADPQFVDADNYDFRIADTSPAISEIGFKPFDPSRAGLVGSDEWRSLSGKIKRPVMKFWSQRGREVNARNEKDRWRAGFTP